MKIVEDKDWKIKVQFKRIQDLENIIEKHEEEVRYAIDLAMDTGRAVGRKELIKFAKKYGRIKTIFKKERKESTG